MARPTVAEILQASLVAACVFLLGTAAITTAQEPPEGASSFGESGSDREAFDATLTPTTPPPAAGARAIRVVDLKHIDMRAAALLMSGQRGGGIDGVLTVGLPDRTDGSVRLPFWIELKSPSPRAAGGSGQWTFEVLVYVLDDDLEVEVFEGRTIRVDLGAEGPRRSGGVRLHGRVDVSPAARSLRVLVQDEGDAFFLDEKVVQVSAGEPAVAEARVVFPDTGEGWIDVDPSDWDSDLGYAAGYEIGDSRVIPQGRPVMSSAAEASFFIVTTTPDREVTSVGGGLRSDSGTPVNPGSFTLVERLPAAIDRTVAYALAWRVPELDPDQYVLELSLSTESGDPMTTEISVLVVPPEMTEERPTWVAYAGARLPTASRTPSDAQLPYTDALRVVASNRWDDGVSGVFELERSTIGGSRSERLPDDLFELEAIVIDGLVDNTANSIIPLLVFHHDVFRAWTQVDDPRGQRHGIRVIAAMANGIRERPALASAVPTAVGVLASVADMLYRLGAPDSAMDVLELALKLDPTHQASLIGTAVDHEWLGHYEAAVELLDGFADWPDTLIEGRLRLAVNQLRIGETREAIAGLQACIQPSAPPWVRAVAYEELAMFHLDNGRPDRAQALIEEAIPLFPDDTTLPLLLAYTEEAQGNLGEARRTLDLLDNRAISTYRESPRRRYARWPSEIFERERGNIRKLAAEHLGDLASALPGQPDDRGQ